LPSAFSDAWNARKLLASLSFSNAVDETDVQLNKQSQQRTSTSRRIVIELIEEDSNQSLSLHSFHSLSLSKDGDNIDLPTAKQDKQQLRPIEEL
jgi:CDP-diacylglycerol pyrophosphatase